MALTWVLTGGAVVDRIPGDAMRETTPGEERGSKDRGRWRLASPSQVGTVLGGDSGLVAKLLVSMVEGSHEIGPSVLGRRAHVPLMDGFRVGAHGFKNANGG